MGSTAAERQRRSRAHRGGDHGMCLPGYCDAVTVTADVTAPVTQPVTPKPSKLGPRGRRLWKDLDAAALPPAARVLAEEACRTADRLDKLDAQLRGADVEWLRMQARDEDSAEVVVVVDRALSEARQQQIALKQILGELRQMSTTPKAAPGPATGRPDERTARPGGSGVIHLAERVAEMRAGTSTA